MTETDGPSQGKNGQPIDDSAPASAEASRPPARKLRLSSVLVGAFLGTMFAGLIAVVILVVLFRDSTPLLTQAEFEAAEQRWDAKGPKSYNLDVISGGKRAGQVHVEVRNGEVTKMVRDGIEPKQKRTWSVWSVPGQFETIEIELNAALDPVAGFQTKAGSQVIQKAVFDARFGYPLRYSRDVLGDADMDVSWQTTHFQVVE